MDYKWFFVGVFTAYLFRILTYLLFAFFDGWDNRTPCKSKAYLLFWKLGNMLYLKKLLKGQLNDEVSEENK